LSHALLFAGITWAFHHKNNKTVEKLIRGAVLGAILAAAFFTISYSLMNNFDFGVLHSLGSTGSKAICVPAALLLFVAVVFTCYQYGYAVHHTEAKANGNNQVQNYQLAKAATTFLITATFGFILSYDICKSFHMENLSTGLTVSLSTLAIGMILGGLVYKFWQTDVSQKEVANDELLGVKQATTKFEKMFSPFN